MAYATLVEVATAGLELMQGALLPVVAVSFVVALLFVILQFAFSLHDSHLQYLVRLLFLVAVIAFLAKGVSENFIEYTKRIYESAPGFVR